MESQEVFDEIAPGWYGRRHYTIFPDELEEIARQWGQGRLLNVGCGHGADFLPFKGSFSLYGLDISRRMLELGVKYSQKFHFSVNLIQADARHLPCRSESFDWAIAIATYHHIEGAANRRLALRELYRVLRPGGEAFITVWNRWQPRFWFRRSDTRVPWHSRNKTIARYYHLYTYRELQMDAKKTGFQVLQVFPEKSYRFPLKIFSRNICLLVKKP